MPQINVFINNSDSRIPLYSPKVMLYSCHDSSLTLLLGMFEELSSVKPLGKKPVNCNSPDNAFWPPYASDIRFELYVDNNNEKWVKVLYNDKVYIYILCIDEIHYILIFCIWANDNYHTTR